MIIKRRDHLERMVMAKPLETIIKSLVDCPIKDFPALLNANLVWNRPKGDLLHWVNVLNKIDEIFEEIINKYGLGDEHTKLQLFSKSDTELVISCLDFTYTLLENSKPDSDRPIYSSSERIFDLINTPTIDVRLKAMEVAVLIGERFAKTSSSKYAAPKIVKARVLTLAHSYPPVLPPNFSQKFANKDNTDDPNSNIPTIIGDSCSYLDTITSNKLLPSKWKSLHYNYFNSVMTSNIKNKNDDKKLSKSKTNKSESNITPTEGVAAFILSEEMVHKLSYEQILDKATESVPEQYWFEIGLMAANAKAFNTTSFDSMNLREKLLRIKCLSIGFITCMCNSQYSSSKLFETEPYTFSFLVDLILPENNKKVSISVFGSALRTLQCISLKKSWCSDIVKCMGGNVNHGLLFQCIRLIHKLVEEESEDYHENIYVYFFVILQYLISTKSLTLRLASGGLLLELMTFLNLKTKYRRTCSAAAKLISIFLLNSPDSIMDFANNDGFTLLIETIKYEVQFALEHPEYDGGAPKDAITYYNISFRQAEYILSLMKLVSEIIESDSGDRLRNLFDSPLLESFNEIILNPKVFGPEILGYTLDCIFYIIHNEPTAFSILNEAKVIDTVLDNYKSLFLPSGDLLKALQYVLSAVCLNKEGLNKVIDKGIIPSYFESFYSIPFAKELVNTDESTGLGSSFDELGRHYPTLKPIILEETKKLVENSADFVDGKISGIRFYNSKFGAFYKGADDKIIENEEGCNEIESWDTADYAYILDNIFFFLGGLLPESGQWGKDSMKMIKFESWSKFLTMQNVPYDFAQSTGVSILLAVLKYFDDENKDYGLPVLANTLKKLLNNAYIQEYINYENTNISYYSRFENDAAKGTLFLKSLSTLQLVLFTITEIYINPNLMFRERYQQVVDIFKREDGLKTLADLGLLLQRSIIEETLVRTNTPKEVVEQTEPTYEMFMTHPIQIFAGDPQDRPSKQQFTSAVFKNTLQVRYFNHSISSQIATILNCAGRVCMHKYQEYNQDIWRRNAVDITKECGKLFTSAMSKNFTNKYYEYCYTLIISNVALYCISQKERSRELVQTSLVISLIQNGFFEVLKSKCQFIWRELLSQDPKEVEKTKKLTYVSISPSSIIKNALSQILSIFVKTVNSDSFPNIPSSKLYFHSGYGKDIDAKILSAILVQTRLVAFDLISSTIGDFNGINSSQAANIPLPILEQIENITKCMIQGKKELEASDFIPLSKLNVTPPLNQVKWLEEAGMTSSQASQFFKHGQDLNDFSKNKWPEYPQIDMSQEEWNKFADLIDSKAQGEGFNFKVEHPNFRNEEDLQLLRFEEQETFVDKWIEICKLYPKAVSSIEELFSVIIPDADMIVSKIFEHVVYLVETKKDRGSNLTQTLKLLCACLRNEKVSSASLQCIEKMLQFLNSELSTNSNFAFESYLPPLFSIFEQVLLFKEIPTPENTQYTNLKVPTLEIPFLISDEMKLRLLEGMLQITNIQDLQSALSISKVLIIYARNYDCAFKIAGSNLMKLLVKTPKKFMDCLGSDFENLKTCIMILIRRCFENVTVLKNNMVAEVNSLFSGSARSKRDLQTCLRETSALIIREPLVYVDTISKEIRLDGFDGTSEFFNGKIQVIKAKKDETVSEDVEMTDATEASQSEEQQDSQRCIESNGIMHILLTELMETIKLDWISSPKDTVEASKKKSEKGKAGDKISRSELFKNENFGYACFLILTVMELVGSYKQAKLDFLTFSKKRNDSKLKPRSTALNFFIHQLIPTHLLEVSSGAEYERRCMISSISKFAIFSFVATPILNEENSPDGKKEDAEMAFIRRFLVEIILKIMKETINAPVVATVRYGKLLDIFDLISSLISPKFRDSNSLLNKHAVKFDQFYTAKSFLDKEISTQITSLLSEIDLNFPESDKITKAGLKPLISLCKAKLEFQTYFEDEFQGEEDDDIVPDEVDDREETPDLFRNSTLGMYDIETDSEEDDDDQLEDGGLEVLISDEEIMESDGGSSGLSDLESNESGDSEMDHYYVNPQGQIEAENSDMEDEEDDDDSVIMGDIEIIDGSGESDSGGSDELSEVSDYYDDENEEFSSVYDDEELDGWIEEFEDEDTNLPIEEEIEPERIEDTPIRNRREVGVRRVDFESNEDSDENLSDIESALDLELVQEIRNARRVFPTNMFDDNYRAAPSLAALLDSFLGEAGVLRSSIRLGGGDRHFDYRRGMNFPFDNASEFNIISKDSEGDNHLFVKSTIERWLDTKKILYPKTKDEMIFRVIPSIINRIEAPSIEIYRKKKEEIEKLKQEREERLRQKEEEERKKKEELAKERDRNLPNESTHTEPVYVLIGDREVDISGTDIDPEFFEALPHDMREEVFTQHVTERRANATSTGTDAREIDPDFLEALPDQIREEILQHESMTRRFASLSDRYDDEYEQDIEDFGQHSERDAASETSRKERKSKRVFFTPLIDRQGISSIVRLLFAPLSLNQREVIYNALNFLCNNKQSRVEIMGLLIAILFDALINQRTIDKLFSQICLRASGQKEGKFKLPFGSTITIISIQIIEAIDFLLDRNTHLRYYLLTEHENPFIQKIINKSSLESNKNSRYSINYLLRLLDSPIVKEEQVFMDILARVLQIATRPLQVLLKVNEEDKPSTFVPPSIPNENYCKIIKILTANECSNTTFRRAISAMQNLSVLPSAQTVFSEELSEQATALGQTIVKDVLELAKELNGSFDSENKLFAKFSSPSSEQAKLLRILTALDYMYESKEKEIENDLTKDENARDKEIAELTGLYTKLSLGTLWDALSECLRVFEEKKEITSLATSLLPLIEALMVVCKHSKVKDLQIKDVLKYEAKKVDFTKEPIERLFFSFTDEHKKILNQMVRSNPNLMSGPFGMLVRNPRVLEFDNKKNYFDRKLHHDNNENTKLSISVRRDQVFLDSFRALFFKSKEEFRNCKLEINFKGESGVDAGGVTREWYQVLSRQMFNPDYALFTPVASDDTTFHPNRTSWVNPEHLSFFKFIGRIIGKAIFDNCFLDCHFSRAVYKRILSRPASLKDMETLDLDYFKSLMWMLENDITDIITEDFSVETDDYGEHKVIDLIPNGRNIPVTEENKQEYVSKIVEYRLQTSVTEQMDNFLIGFHEIIPKELVAIFDEQELELLISGLPDINVEDWQQHTTYNNYSPSADQIQWFWRAVKSFDNEERAKLLQFATGTSKVPLNGFKELSGANGICKFSIHRDYGSTDRLPSSHTCFNQIDLPQYKSYEELRGSLLLAITEGHEGFGLA